MSGPKLVSFIDLEGEDYAGSVGFAFEAVGFKRGGPPNKLLRLGKEQNWKSYPKP